MSQSGPKTTSEDQREQHLADVARLYLDGLTQWRIGEQLGVTQQQVSYDLKIIRTRWLESSIRDFDEARAQEIAKIDDTEREFRSAWKRSYTGEDSGPGDPRFLDGILKCVSKRCELLGLDAAKKVSLTDSDGNNYGPFLTDEERRSRLLALIAEQGTESGPGQTIM